MDTQQKIIKTFNPSKCPHCGKDYYIGIQSMMSQVVSTPTIEDVKKAKEDIKERLNELKFNNEIDKQEIIAYLDNENTIIDAVDIEPMLKQIATDQLKK